MESMNLYPNVRKLLDDRNFRLLKKIIT
jgi:hypothetical protein